MMKENVRISKKLCTSVMLFLIFLLLQMMINVRRRRSEKNLEVNSKSILEQLNLFCNSGCPSPEQHDRGHCAPPPPGRTIRHD
ncbi:hypothetical protein ACS0TY_000396 [Phlomoides rotata]